MGQERRISAARNISALPPRADVGADIVEPLVSAISDPNALQQTHRYSASMTEVDTDQLARSFTRGRGGPASSAAFRASFICKICIIRFFLAGALLAFRANVSTDGRTAFRALVISSYA